MFIFRQSLDGAVRPRLGRLADRRKLGRYLTVRFQLGKLAKPTFS